MGQITQVEITDVGPNSLVGRRVDTSPQSDAAA